MEKPTKEQLNYRLPEKCCANCAYSGYNSYSDTICTEMKSGQTIDAGGVCDYHKEVEG